MDSAGTFTDLEILAATGACLELMAFRYVACKLKPDSRKQIRRLKNEPLMMIRLRLHSVDA